MYTVLIDKAEGDVYEKIKMVEDEDGGKAYGILYKWFTDVSGLGLLEQVQRLPQLLLILPAVPFLPRQRP